MLEICRIYGWTYDQYMAQPHWFAELATEKLIIDRKRQAETDGVR